MQQALNPVAPYPGSGAVLLLNPTDRQVQAAYGMTAAQLRSPAVIRGTAPTYTPPSTANVVSLSPATVVHGVANASVTVTGTGFTSGCQIWYNGTALTTTFTNATTCSATFPHSTAPVGVAKIQVKNTGEQVSDAYALFTYT